MILVLNLIVANDFPVVISSCNNHPTIFLTAHLIVCIQDSGVGYPTCDYLSLHRNCADYLCLSPHRPGTRRVVVCWSVVLLYNLIVAIDLPGTNPPPVIIFTFEL